MRVVSVPSRLRWALGMLVLSVPFAAIQTILVSRAPWWRIPLQTVQIWSASVALICLALGYWLSLGRQWALHLTFFFALTWCFLSAWFAFLLKAPTLGFFTVLLTAYWMVTLAWIRHELGRSFFDPMLKWYQGFPQPVPGVNCEWGEGESRASLRVGRIDREGVIVFGQLQSKWPKRGESIELRFSFRNREARCKATPAIIFADGAGAGFEFKGMSPDAKKSLGDFVEAIRGEGHEK